MAETQAPPPLPKSQPSFTRRNRTIIKLLGVGALVLVLLIPLELITGVLSDRLSRRNAAVEDITSSWGREQNVIGPVLGIPLQYKFKAVKETPGPDGKLERREVEETATAAAYFLPQSLKIGGDVQTQTLHRGIYDAAVFRAALCLFYLLLLSISEFVGFGWAYLIAAVASTLLITWYCRFFLGGGVRTLMIGAGLAGVYTFL